MGQEADCTVTVRGRTSRGRAYLETDALLFRGAFRLAIPYAQMTSVKAQGGRLVVRSSGGVATFAVGPRAEAWLQKILHPKSLIDKLGVKPQDRVATLGVGDAEFLSQLRSRTKAVMRERVPRGLDAIFLRADRTPVLDRLRTLRAAVKPAGAIWVVAPKGIAAITEADVLAAGRRAGLVDVKVVRFSDTHTAHKFVIPMARRQK